MTLKVFINMNLNFEFLAETLGNGGTVSQRIEKYLRQFEQEIQVYSLVRETGRALEGSQELILSSDNFIDMLEILKEKTDEDDKILYFYGDSPFLDFELSREMVETHEKYYADYSFADGYPSGLSPEIINSSILSRLIELGKEQDPGIETRDAFFQLIQKDINSFDIETSLSPIDFRSRRLQLLCNDPANRLLCERIASQCDKPLLEWLDEHSEIDRTLPSYIAIQINSGCPQACRLCPYPLMNPDLLTVNRQMDVESFDAILTQIDSLNPYAYISLSPWGEPALHNQLPELVKLVFKRPHFRLVMETSGLGWGQSLAEEVASEIQDMSRFSLILSLDAQNPDLYKSVRGEGYHEVQAIIPVLEKLFGNQFWIQAVRSIENEEHLEHFYRFWKEKKNQLIIQKYDNYCGRLPELSVTDLTPLEREPCWHLKRDMTILLNGNVPLCREDTHGDTSLGNIFKERADILWQRGNAGFKQHCQGEFLGICGKCDEYYTFNF